MQDLRDFLIAILRGAILAIARDYLADSEAYKMRSGKPEYRSSDELATIDSAIEQKAEEMSTDFADELEAKGVVTPSDYFEKQQIVKTALDGYRDKFTKWLQEQ
jgi:hypothetical protein